MVCYFVAFSDCCQRSWEYENETDRKSVSFSYYPHEGLRRNIAARGSTPPPPAVGSSLGRVSVLAQGMGEGPSSKFTGQASGKWSVILLRFLIVANTRGLRFFFGGGGTAMLRTYSLGSNDRKRDRDFWWD